MLSITCKTGKLELTDENMLRSVRPLNMGILWQIPASSVKDIIAQPGILGILNLTIKTEQGDFQVETVAPQNFEKLQNVLHIQAMYVQAEKKVKPRKYKNWYEDPELRAH